MLLLSGPLRSRISSRVTLELLSTKIQHLPRLSSNRATSQLGSTTSSTSELIVPSLPSSSSSSPSPPHSSASVPTPLKSSSTSKSPLPTEFAFPLVFQHPTHPQPFNMLHDVKIARATRLALMDGVDYDTSIARRQTASRLCSPDRKIVARAMLTSDIAKVVRGQGFELAIFGSISTKTHVDRNYLSLAVVTGDDSRVPSEILAGLVEPLRAAGVVVSKLATDNSSRMTCESAPSPTGDQGTIAFVSIQASQNSLLNSLVASYTALSPDVLAPFIRAVGAIGPGKNFIVKDTHRNQMISFLCIAYLQSLASPLLPNLQSKDLIAKLKPPPSQSSLPVRRTHAGYEMVDTTFVPIGLTPPLREKLGWKQGTKEDQEFARQWIGKGRGRNVPSLSDLVRGFYMVYGGKARSMFDWNTGVVAVRYGGLKVRSEVEGRLSWKRGTLVIQHPFVDTINLSAEVKEGPDEIEAMFARCLEDELLRDGAPPLEDFMYLSSSHHRSYTEHDHGPSHQAPAFLSPPSPSPSSSTPNHPPTLPPSSSTPPAGSDPQGYKIIFENLPSTFDLATFDRFLQASKLELVGPSLLVASGADGKPVGGIVAKDLQAALKLDRMILWGQPISVKISPSSSSS